MNFRLITKLAEHLQLFKLFNTGYSTGNRNAMLIEMDGKVYYVTAKELGEGIVDDYIKIL